MITVPPLGAVTNQMLSGITFMTFHDLPITTLGVPTSAEALAGRKGSFSTTLSAFSFRTALKECIGFCIRFDERGRVATSLAALPSHKTAHTPHRLLGVPAPAFLRLAVLPVYESICLGWSQTGDVFKTGFIKLGAIVTCGVSVCSTAHMGSLLSGGWVPSTTARQTV